MRKGIAIAGNIVMDHSKVIETYPDPGMLATIVKLSHAPGGNLINTGISLSRVDREIPLYALGRIGNDDAGHSMLAELQKNGIHTDGVIVSATSETSFSDAMLAKDTGERTFFHYRGANAEFCPEDVDLDKLPCELMHIAYLLLLDRFDQKDPEYGTVMARFLRDAQRHGIRTSIDVVSEKTGRFAEVVVPALRYCDYAIMNEIESCAVTGLPPRDGQGRLIDENIIATMKEFQRLGVSGRVVVHAPEKGFCLDAREGLSVVPSLKLPKGYIQNTVGAGDAFCAGCLYAIYQGMSGEEMLAYGSATAAASLSAPDSTSGVLPAEKLAEMIATWPRQAV